MIHDVGKTDRGTGRGVPVVRRNECPGGMTF